MSKIEAMVQEARKLSPDERAELIERLIEVADNSPDPVAQRWLELAEARMEGVRKGEVETLDFDEGIAEARQRLAKNRARRARGK